MLMPFLRHPRALGALACLVATSAALAQGTAPGMQLQQPVPPQPRPDSAPPLPAAPAASPGSAVAGGTRVVLQRVVFEGHRLFDTATLTAALGPVQGQTFDLAGLEALAARVAEHYRRNGFPFTQALLPAQNLADGTLRIEVIEGRYGRIAAEGRDPQVPGAQPFLDAELQRGAPIEGPRLERAMLLLNDQPGFRVQPVLRPGAQRGEGDLAVMVERRSDRSGEIGLDNAGSRATGQHRLRGSLQFNSPWRFGDRVALTGLVTEQRMWLGSADYETPLDGRGLRAGASVARTSYQLDGAFSALSAQGQADVVGARLSQSVLRSQRRNLTLTATLQHKRLHDDFGDGVLVRDKRSDQVIVAAQFDHRDALLGGGVTYGAASATLGRLQLDADSATADALTAQTAGRFAKWNLDIARIQKLPGALSAYLRVSSQGASKNLDASEKLGLGGFLGVRAYPLGEGQGDRGWFGQLELRWSLDAATTVFAFHDAGRMRTNQRPWSADSAGERHIGGAGLGLRWLQGPWSVDATLAQRTEGGAAQSDSADRNPRAFVVVGYRFE